jgi:hypothetical protein
MPWSWPIMAAIFVQVDLPLWFLASLALERSSSYASFYTKAAAFALFFILIFFAGRWDLVGVWLRYGLIPGFVLAFVIGRHRCRGSPRWPRPNLRSLGGTALNLLVAAVFAVPLWQILTDTSCSERASDLAFPIRDVDWYVGQGGGVPVLNYHAAVRAQAYALDIVALNGFGTRADGLQPADLEDLWGSCRRTLQRGRRQHARRTAGPRARRARSRQSCRQPRRHRLPGRHDRSGSPQARQHRGGAWRGGRGARPDRRRRQQRQHR